MKKIFKTSDIRKLEQQVASGEITYSRMVEIMNEMANEGMSISGKPIDEVEKMLKSDTVYWALRFSIKSPSKTGVDDCDDHGYFDLFELVKTLQK